jgi:hypothetical protein
MTCLGEWFVAAQNALSQAISPRSDQRTKKEDS